MTKYFRTPNWKFLLVYLSASVMVLYVLSCGSSGSDEEKNFDAYFWHSSLIPYEVQVLDFNGDQLDDVVLGTATGNATDFNSVDNTIVVFLQDEFGYLYINQVIDGPIGNYPRTIDVGDVNNDDIPDVATNSVDGIMLFSQDESGYLTTGTIGASIPLTWFTCQIKLGNLNNDTRQDIGLILHNYGSDTMNLYSQDVDGFFSTMETITFPHNGNNTLDIQDIDGDGLDDILVTFSYSPNDFVIIRQNASGFLGTPEYFDFQTTDFVTGRAIGDLNGDERDDIILSHWSKDHTQECRGSGITPFLQQEDGSFIMGEIANYTASRFCGGIRSIAIGDFDGDGQNDLVGQARELYNAVILYLEPGGSAIRNTETYRFPGCSRTFNKDTIATGDLDNDGDLDFVFTQKTCVDYMGLYLLFNKRIDLESTE